MVNKFNDWIRYPEKVPCDKRMHFIVGTVVAFIMAMLGFSVLSMVSGVIGTAWGIEIYQKITGSGTYDNWDVIAVVAGALPIIVLELFKV